MITSRDEVLDNAFRVFARMNYEKASFTEIAKACGLSRAGIIHYYPYKQELFEAVVDRFFFNAQHPDNKYNGVEGTLKEFISRFITGIDETMNRIVVALRDKDEPSDIICPNFYYFHFMMQIHIYYPNAKQKLAALIEHNKRMWAEVIDNAKLSGEIRSDADTELTAMLFHNIYFGQSYEEAFMNGLDTKTLYTKLMYLYSLLQR